jgi:sec-independent protein translocase protein TatA
MGGTEWLIVAVVVLVLFGGSQLPKLARSLGEAQKEFKKGIEPDDKNGTGAAKTDPSKPDES